ncbi:hypothetical protein JTB14_015735 [Gonioctena quinquepunctata]|nr:hypothetical protein JTB14_015735 [Gonioctena quinquepunctata]
MGCRPEPWSRLHLDFAGPFGSKMWMILIDSYTHWLEVIPMRDITLGSTIEVWVNNPLSKGSLPGKIVKRTGPLSYFVELDGILRRKHCDQMRERKLMINTNEPSHQDMSDEFEDYQSSQLHQSASCNESESSLNEVEAEEGEWNNVDHSLSRECVIPRRSPFRIRKPPSHFSE